MSPLLSLVLVLVYDLNTWLTCSQFDVIIDDSDRYHVVALGCKRPAYDAGWLASLHLPNVTLNSVGIASITETSIIDATGKEFPADVIVFATGSDVARHGVGLNVGLYGEDGVELREFWKEIGGPQSYRGLAVPGVSPKIATQTATPYTC